MARPKLFARHLAPALRAGLKDTPVLIVVGARQTGRSTLAKGLIGAQFAAEY